MHLTTSCHTEGFGAVGFINVQRNVLESFLEQTVTQVTGGQELALLARKWAVVDREGHLNGRCGNFDKFQRLYCCLLYTSDFVITTDDRVELFISGILHQVVSIFFKHIIGILRRIAGDTGVAAHLLEHLQKVVLLDVKQLEQLFEVLIRCV